MWGWALISSSAPAAARSGGKAGRGERRSAFADEDEGRRRALSLEPAKRSQLVALDWVRARRAVLSNQSAIPGSGGSMPSAVAKALR
jgi:hypothetical protein